MLGMTNWKTTAAGAATILTAAGHLLSGASHGDWSGLGTDVPLIFAGLVGILAKDHNVTGGTIQQ